MSLNCFSIIKETLFSLISYSERDFLEKSCEQIQEDYATHFVRVFATVNRQLSIESKQQLVSIPELDKLIINNWSIVRLARVWLLGHIKDDKTAYHAFVERLFNFADMEELIALYSALPMLDYPEVWIERCKEGIRSNIGLVQEAIIEENKYPYYYLSEDAWNQTVLKAFFTSKNVLNIYGLFERNNKKLAESIVDYIYERYSAKRNIDPILWLLAEEYLPERALNILLELLVTVQNKVDQAILFQVARYNKGNLPKDIDFNALGLDVEFVLSTEDILENYKNSRALCVQN